MNIKWLIVFLPLIVILLVAANIQEERVPVEKNSKITYSESDHSCLSCHKGVEHIMEPSSDMMQEIYELADKAGIEGNSCVVCHGGNPEFNTKEEAHHGTIEYFVNNKGPKEFYPDPGSPWININTCGLCHKEQVSTQFSSLMFTEAGKIQGTLWGFGGMNGYKHDVGNYHTESKDVHEVLGTEQYKKYMEELVALEPNLFPNRMTELPPAPTADEVEEDPQLAVYTYLRQECQRCHTGNQGRSKRGDYRGLGCSSCHMPYGNEGLYEGGDSSISKSERGHPLVHSMQSTREKKVKVHGKEYSGIPVETCTTCHDRGKRIGTSFQGLMETAYGSPFGDDGSDQPKLHTKKYLHLHSDLHKDKGMLCQDCHTSGDVHGDGMLAGTTLAPVEIECEDCHGTPTKYPWELPIGYGDRIGGSPYKGDGRGVAQEIAKYLKQGTTYEKQDGYLVTARGNPLPNVVKTGNEVIVHTAGGKDLKLQPLKKLKDEEKLSLEAEVAMVCVDGHMDKMECYTCHSTWAPQCYGCHVKVDYSLGEKHTDWVSAGKDHDASGLTADARKELAKHMIDGKVSESRSYLRWENPPLVVNGESRVSPGMPGCQTTVTVIGKSGKTLLKNHIFKIPNVEGAGEEGQNGIDISPVHPHTVTKEARKCESCHTNPVAMGYGIEGGKIYEDPSKEYNVDLSTADGEVLPKQFQTQINSIPNLKDDWSRFVTEDGKQLQTVGHHYQSSRPLNNEERQMLDRRGVCLACHQTVPEGNMAVSLLHHVKEMQGKKYNNEDHNALIGKIVNTSAWGQVLLIIGALIAGVFIGIRVVNKRKIRG